jgi:argininosuccinate lyase
MKLWGGRFEEKPSEVFERFSGSLHFDRRLLNADIRGSQAWARALGRVGILETMQVEMLVAAFDAIWGESGDPAFWEGAGDEDVHTLVIRKLREKAPGLADRIHTGRSRNEQVSLDSRLWLREELDLTTTALRDLIKMLITLARRWQDAIIPGYTHLRRAQAVLWPHYVLAYVDMFFRDLERLLETRRRVNVLPLGSGALAGSGFPFDRDELARDLGFAAVSTNSMDVSADRDFVLDYLYTGSMIMLHLSRLAEDWILYSSDEFGWMELGDAVTSGSSLMPQKKNPDSLELIRGRCGRVFGALNSVFVTMKGLPLTYNRDMQEDKEPLFDAADLLRGSLEMARVVSGSITLKPEIAEQAARTSWVVATDLAEALARAGTPFHRAHQIVGRLVLESVRTGKSPAEWTGDQLAAFAPELTPDMAPLLNPAEGMKTRTLRGGTAPQTVAAALAAAEERLVSAV